MWSVMCCKKNTIDCLCVLLLGDVVKRVPKCIIRWHAGLDGRKEAYVTKMRFAAEFSTGVTLLCIYFSSEIDLFIVVMKMYLHICVSTYLSVHISICQYLYQSVGQSVYQSYLFFLFHLSFLMPVLFFPFSSSFLTYFSFFRSLFHLTFVCFL
jgi:hypothetical protein